MKMFSFQLTPIHTTVFRQLSATDLDSGPAKNVDFYFIEGDGSIVSQAYILVEIHILHFVHIHQTAMFSSQSLNIGGILSGAWIVYVSRPGGLIIPKSCRSVIKLLPNQMEVTVFHISLKTPKPSLYFRTTTPSVLCYIGCLSVALCVWAKTATVSHTDF